MIDKVVERLQYNIDDVSNITTKKNLANLQKLAIKFLDESDVVNLSNAGTIAEVIVTKILMQVYSDREVKPHTNKNAHYDLTINNRKAEIKCTLNGKPNALFEPHIVFVLGTKGLYKISAKDSKNYVGKQITNGMLKYSDLFITMQGLLKM